MPMRCRLSGPSVPGWDVRLEQSKTVPNSSRFKEPTTSLGIKSPPVYLYEADIESDTVRRKFKKHCFKTKPWGYLKEGSNGKLPLEIQAVYQAARPVLNSLRESRISITKALSSGSNSWHTSYARLTSYGDSLWNDSKTNDSLNLVYRRYYKFCISEISFCRRQLELLVGNPNRTIGLRPSDGNRRPSSLMRGTFNARDPLDF